MTSNYEAVIKALRNYRERIRSSRGIRGKLTRLDRIIVKSRQNLSQIEDSNARRALELTRRSRKHLHAALYGYIESYYDQNKELERGILSQNSTSKRSDEATTSTDNHNANVSDERIRQKNFEQLGEIGQSSRIPTFKQWLQKCKYLNILENREMNINHVYRFDLPSEMSWWKTTIRRYENGDDSIYGHIVSRHGSEIAKKCKLTCDADVSKYLSRLAASTNEATCMQFEQFRVAYQNGSRVLQDEGNIVKLDTETHVGIIMSVDSKGGVVPITAFIVDKGYLRRRVDPNANSRKWE